MAPLQSAPDAVFQKLLERSDVVFRKLDKITHSPDPDIEAMKKLTAEALTIADQMAKLVKKKRAGRDTESPRRPAAFGLG